MNRIVWSLLAARLKQPSSWAGIVAFISGLFGITLKPEYATAITTVAVALASLVCVVVDDRHPVQLSKPAVPPQHETPVRPSPTPVRDRFGTGSNV